MLPELQTENRDWFVPKHHLCYVRAAQKHQEMELEKLCTPPSLHWSQDHAVPKEREQTQGETLSGSENPPKTLHKQMASFGF